MSEPDQTKEEMPDPSQKAVWDQVRTGGIVKSLIFCPTIAAVHVIRVTYWLIFLVVMLEFLDLAPVVKILESGDGTLCHHIPSRCFHNGAGLWAVCARCSGMYAGWVGAAGMFAIPAGMFPAGRKILLGAIAGLVLALTAALAERIGLFVSGNEVRFFWGLLLGLSAGALMITVSCLLKHERTANRTP